MTTPNTQDPVSRESLLKKVDAYAERYKEAGITIAAISDVRQIIAEAPGVEPTLPASKPCYFRQITQNGFSGHEHEWQDGTRVVVLFNKSGAFHSIEMSRIGGCPDPKLHQQPPPMKG